MLKVDLQGANEECRELVKKLKEYYYALKSGTSFEPDFGAEDTVKYCQEIQLMTGRLNNLKRYIRASKYDVETAYERVLETCHWRVKYKVLEICRNPEKLAAVRAQRKMFIQGQDKKGRPIIWNRKSPAAQDDHEDDLKNTIYVLESAVHNMHPEGDGKWVWVLDLHYYTRSNSSSFSLVKKTLEIFQDHYPERLHAAFIIDAPWVFSAMYTMISPFVDEVTKKKFTWLENRDSPKTRGILLQSIEKHELPVDFGGTRPIQPVVPTAIALIDEKNYLSEPAEHDEKKSVDVVLHTESDDVSASTEHVEAKELNAEVDAVLEEVKDPVANVQEGFVAVMNMSESISVVTAETVAAELSEAEVSEAEVPETAPKVETVPSDNADTPDTADNPEAATEPTKQPEGNEEKSPDDDV